MMGWLSRLFSGRPEPKAAAQAHERTEPVMPGPPVTPAARPASAESAPGPTPEATATLPWLLNCAALTESPMSDIEAMALAALDKTLTLPAIPDNLLPRAAALIPQLIALVRQTDLPVPAIAARVGKDTVLTAELLRLASSSYYRVQGDVTDLEQAISLIGLQGLQTVIARVLLKPIYQSTPGALSARAAPRMWEHSEALARHTAILSEPAGQMVFDGYLAGMLHDTGWTVALSVLDRAGIALNLPPSAGFATELEDRVHRIFGLAALRWDITPGFTAFTLDARKNGLFGAAHPLAQVLQQADQRCMEELTVSQTVPAPLAR